MNNIQTEVTQTFSKEQVAAYLGTSIGTINRLVYSGQISSLKLGRSIRIEREAIEAYKSNKQLKPSNNG